MLPPADSGASASLISADPAALDRFAAGAVTRTRGVEAAATAVDHAVATWNSRPCDPRYRVHLEPFGEQINGLAQQWTMGDNFVSLVAAAFRRADAGGGPIRFAGQGAVDKGMQATADYNPFASLTAGTPGEWARMVRDMCYAGGAGYLGGGFIVGPDGRRYPLVIPQVKDGGKLYQADDGGGGDVATLDGADPGWFNTGIYTGRGQLFPARTTGPAIAAFVNHLFGGNASVGNASSPGDYNGLVIGDGRPSWYAHGSPQLNAAAKPGLAKADDPLFGPLPGRSAGPSLTRGAGAANLALLPANAVLGAASAAEQAKANHYGAYQLRLERNLDGRVRARLTMYAMANDDDGSRVIAPIGVGVGDHGAQIIHYRPHVEPSGAHAEPGGKGDYHILDHFEEADGFFDNHDKPYKYAYQDK